MDGATLFCRTITCMGKWGARGFALDASFTHNKGMENSTLECAGCDHVRMGLPSINSC